MPEYENLGDLRERLFGLPPGFVARTTGIEEARLTAIEAGEPPTMAELAHLEGVYGIDDDLLAEEPIEVPASDGVNALALLDEFREVRPLSKRRLLLAARAAHDVVELRARLTRPRGYDQLMARPRPTAPPAWYRPFHQGASWAHAWRRELGLGEARIRSVRDLLGEHFPEIAVLHIDLADDKICGVSFADTARGPTIVLNTRGKNENPLVRRFSALHELAHLLIDAQRGQPLASVSGFLTEAQREVEQRANAFAVRMLCSHRALERVVRHQPDWFAAVGRLVQRYGLDFRAAELYLRKQAELTSEGAAEAETLLQVPAEWAGAEDWGLSNGPYDELGVPTERRTDVARLAAAAFSRGALRRDRFARYLGVTPDVEVERVLDWLSLDHPAETAD